MNNIKYSFVFISQPGDLEIKSLFLALSLKESLPLQSEIIVAIPEINGKIDFPSESGMNIFRKNGIIIENFANSFCRDSDDRLPGDIISNKIFCININARGKKIIFLDSDMLCLSKIHFDDDIQSYDFLAKQADVSNVRRWDEIYSLFKMNKPEILVECTVDKYLLPPYFNSGFIMVEKCHAKVLFSTWMDIFIKISKNDIIKKDLFNPVNRDQVALSIAVQKLKLGYQFLDETFNYPVRIKKLPDHQIPSIVHYHDPLTIFRNKLLVEKVKKYCYENPEIISLIHNNRIWNRVFYSSRAKREVMFMRFNLRRKYHSLKRNVISKGRD